VEQDEPLSWLYAREAMGIKLGLDNITRLLHHLGDPHLRFRSAHVAGTNGKGSVSAMTASVIMEAGYRTGLYTSPHLVDFRERIQVDREPISRPALIRMAEEVREYAERPCSREQRLTFFEITTAMAFAHFAEAGVEEAVIEVGMGGRLDATNVIVPDACAITRIGLEHTKYLGTTLVEIAGEKAGIIKPRVPVVTIDQDPDVLDVFTSKSMSMNAPLKVVGADVGYETISSTLYGTEVWVEEVGGRVSVPLAGRYQGANCALACGLLTELMKRGVYIPEEAIPRGLSKARWPGRMEVVGRSPTMVVDVTHTAEGAREVGTEVRRLLGEDIILVLGVLEDKDLEGIVSAFGPVAMAAVATAPETPRALPPDVVASELRRWCPQVLVVEDVAAAIEAALSLAAPATAVLITGSLYTAGEAYRWLDARKAGERDP
jgi:dihydrofolate synthase / folylpolyglutamate synthase